MSSLHHSRQLSSSSAQTSSIHHPSQQQLFHHHHQPLAHLSGNQMLATKQLSSEQQQKSKHQMPYQHQQQLLKQSSSSSSSSRPKSRSRAQDHPDPRWIEVEQRYNAQKMSSSMREVPLSPLSAVTLPAQRGGGGSSSVPAPPLTPQYQQQQKTKPTRSSSTIPKHPSPSPTPTSSSTAKAQQQLDKQQQQQQLQQQSHHHHQRPRSISTGRLLQGVGTEQDPTSVARALLHLREQRLLATTANMHRSSSNKSPRQPRPTSNGSSSQHHQPQPQQQQQKQKPQQQQQQQQHPGPPPPLSIPRSKSLMDQPTSPCHASSPRGLIRSSTTGVSSVTGSFSDLDDEDRLLRQTNEKINNLMQELDEVQFFHEVEAASPQKTVAGVPARDRVPLVVGVMSPTAGGSGLNSPQSPPLLSPREFSALDRTSLELEAQTMARRIQVLEREKGALLATVEQNELHQREQEDQAKNIRSLQDKIQHLQGEFQSQFQILKQGRERLVNDYEVRLKQAGQQTMQMEQHVSQVDKQLDKARMELQRVQDKHRQEQSALKEEQQRRHIEAKQREQVLELQVAETNMKVDNLSEHLKDAAEKLVTLQMELTQVKDTRDKYAEREEAHRTQLNAVEQQLSTSKESSRQLQEELMQQQQIIEHQKSRLTEAQAEQDRQRQSIIQLQSQLDSIKLEHVIDLEALKQRQEEKEKKRMDEYVAEQQGQLKEFQQRLVTLQHQLTQATDRHIAEMKAKDEQLGVKAQTMVQIQVEEVQREYEDKMRLVSEELVLMQGKYQELHVEHLRLQVEAESRDRDLSREWERKDSLRLGELERMHDKLDRLNRELAEKQQRLDVMAERLIELESRNQSNLSELVRQHTEELAAKDDLIAKQRQLFMANEAKLRTDLARKEAELLELQDGSVSEELLVQQLNDTKRELEQAKRALQNDDETTKQRVQDLQATVERVQTELVSEQARHESLEGELRVEIAKLDGKLKATESTLKQKRCLIEELEDRLTNADEESSTVGRGLNIEIASLKRELTSLQDQLAQEQTAKEECHSVIATLKLEKSQQQAKLDELSKLESTVEALRKMVANTEDEKISRVVELTKVRKEKDEVQGRMEELERRMADEKQELSAEFERKESEMKKMIDNCNATIVKLENSLAEHTQHQEQLQAEILRLKEDLANASEVSTEASELRERVLELEKAVEFHKTLEQERESNARMAMSRFEEQLAEASESQKVSNEQVEALRRDKDELMEALEGVIHEVQSREEEIEALSTILHKRDEELDHAKLIATKALASAQEIKSRYKEKGERDAGRQTELKTKIEEINENLEYLTNENNALKRELTDLTRDLEDRNFECTRLRDRLRDQQQPQQQSPPLANGNGSPTSNGWSNSRRGKKSTILEAEYIAVDENGFLAPEPSPVKTLDQKFAKQYEDQHKNRQPFVADETMSTKTADLGEPTKWLHDFDSEDAHSRTGSSDGIRSEPGLSQSRRSIERDALRKYVRKRYLKYSSAKGGQEINGAR